MIQCQRSLEQFGRAETMNLNDARKQRDLIINGSDQALWESVVVEVSPNTFAIMTPLEALESNLRIILDA